VEYRRLIEQYREQVPQIEPGGVDAGGFDVIIDVREPVQRFEGSIPDSIALPRSELEREIERSVPDRDASILLYCVVGESSIFAAHTLRALGYGNVASLAGGIRRWRAEGRPIVLDDALATHERIRYDRQLRLHEVGEQGQQLLLDSSAVVVGAGGLGSPVAIYLAAAGVGRIGIVDFDRVDLTNIHRQILHDTPSVGTMKTESAAQRLEAINPTIKVETHHTQLTDENAVELVGDFDVIVDASDNFPTRLALNDAAVATGIPLVHGSALRFEGSVAVFDPPAGPCYRCLFPVLPDDTATCSDVGVLGALTGVIGSTQAVETIKVLLGVRPLSGRLLTYDALRSQWARFRFDKDPSCTACGSA
jgi:sulfur-carrier protein adenylyltransferase/sulfurtransferase